MDKRDNPTIGDFGQYLTANQATMKARATDDLVTMLYECGDHSDAEIEAIANAEIKVKWAVCGVCDGRGKHVNPNIDRNGLTAEDFDANPGFYEDYMGGVYDVLCDRCKGRNVELVIDGAVATEASKRLVKAIYTFIREDGAYAQECAAERRMGA